MALVTRCPQCSTTFRVTPLHLQAHGGDVRCGHCAHVFNGFATLTTVQAPASSDPATLLPTLDEMQGAETTATAPKASTLKSSDMSSTTPGLYSFGVSPRKTSWAWGLASLLLLVALAGQASYFYRTELSVLVPAARPYLERYCELLQCIVALPQHAELLSIEASDLQADPAQAAGVITLTATVRNRAPFPQALPALELTLTDTQNQPLASRIFTPADYLGKKADPSQAIEPNHAINLRLHLDSGDLKAAGYRLFLFYL